MSTIRIEAEIVQSPNGSFFRPRLRIANIGERVIRVKGWQTVRDQSDDAASIVTVSKEGPFDRAFIVAADDYTGPSIEVQSELELCQAGKTYLTLWGDDNGMPDEGGMIHLSTVAGTAGTMKSFRVVGYHHGEI